MVCYLSGFGVLCAVWVSVLMGVSFLLLVGGFLELLPCQFSCVWCGGCLVSVFVGIAVVLGAFLIFVWLLVISAVC